MNLELHLSVEDHKKFCDRFLSDRKKITLSPRTLSASSLDDNIVSKENESKSSSSLNSSPSNVLKTNIKNESKSSKLQKLKGHVLNVLEKKKNQASLNHLSKGTTLFSESRKKRLSEEKPITDIRNLPPVLNNNIKMFINKVKRIAYVNDISALKQYDLSIINDCTYYEPEIQNKSFSFKRKLEQCHGKWAQIIEKMETFMNIKKFSFSVIHPYDKAKLFWDLLICIMTIFLLFYIPFNFSFEISFMKENEIKTYIAIILVIDMFLEMNTLYFNYGLEVKNRWNILKNYAKSYFFPDLIALFSILIGIQGEFAGTGFRDACGLLFYMKIFSLGKFNSKMMNRFQLSHESKGVKRLVSLFFLIILITHIAACGWYYVGIHAEAGIKQTDTWIRSQGLENQVWYIQYMSSFYWSIVTVMTVGYGDITPQNYSERLFCLFVILFGGMMFPYSINSIGLIIQDIQRDKKKFDDTLDIMNAYMHRKNVTPDLQTRIREYLKFMWKEEKSQNMEEEKKIINTLSHSLKEELNLEAYGFFLKNNPLFTKFFSEQSLKKMVNVMKEIFLTPDDAIFLQNQKDDNSAIYFIGKGNVKLYSEQINKAPILVKELNEGDYFGERSFFTNLKRENTAISNKFTTLFMITREDFISTIRENRNDYVFIWL